MKQRAFTLIETLIAAVIAVALLGASMAANRLISQSGGLTTQQLTMRMLAEEAVANLRLLRASTPSGTDLGGELGLASGQSLDQVADLVFLNSTGSLNNCVSGSGGSITCPGQEDGGPLPISWCELVKGSYSCHLPGDANLYSPIGVSDASNPSCGVSGGSGCLLSSLIGGLRADLVAVRRTPYATTPSTCSSGHTSNQNNTNRQVIDAASALQVDGASSTCLYTGSSTDLPNWDIYERQVQITRLGTCGTGSSCAYFNQDLNTPSANNQVMRNHTYTLTITIFNYFNPSSRFIKSINLYDTSF